MALTAAQIDAEIDAAFAAVTGLRAGKKFVAIGGRSFSSRDLKQLTDYLDWLRAKAAELAGTSRSGVIAFREPA